MKPVVLRLIPTPRPSAAKTRLRNKALTGVSRIIALAPVLGRCNPASVSTVTDIMETLIGDPPRGGGVVTTPARRQATAADPPTRRRAAHPPRITAFTTVWAEIVFVPACARLERRPALSSRSA